MSEKNVRLSLKDLAYAIENEFEAMSREGRATLAAVIRDDPRLAEQVAEVLAIARDCAMEEHLSGAMQIHQWWEALLVEGSWDQAFKLMEEDPEDIWYPSLRRFAEIRIERAGNPSRLRALKRRLEAAHASFHLGTEVFRVFAQHLEELDPDTAELMLERLANRIRDPEEPAETP